MHFGGVFTGLDNKFSGSNLKFGFSIPTWLEINWDISYHAYVKQTVFWRLLFVLFWENMTLHLGTHDIVARNIG